MGRPPHHLAGLDALLVGVKAPDAVEDHVGRVLLHPRILVQGGLDRVLAEDLDGDLQLALVVLGQADLALGLRGGAGRAIRVEAGVVEALPSARLDFPRVQVDVANGRKRRGGR